jgi:coproporphyrinogen III oxidase-like Fe-S oxidoreductase
VVACVDELVDAGLLDRQGDRLALTRPGRLLANDVIARLLAARDHDRDRRAEHSPRAAAGTR